MFAPNTVQVPVQVFEMLAEITSLAELKVMMIAIEQEFRYNAPQKPTSLTELEGRTGLTRQGVVNGTHAGVKDGYLEKIPVGRSFAYRLIVNEVDHKSQRSRLTTTTTIDKDSRNIVRLWESEARTMITRSMRKKLDYFVEVHGFDETVDAIEEAVATVGPGQFGTNYIAAILERWRVKGRDAPKPDTDNPYRNRKVLR